MSRRERALADRSLLRARILALALAVTGAALAATLARAQPPRELAPFDITGYWVAIVNEDWRWRMLTPPKGDVESITMLNARGLEVTNAWDPSEEGSCKAYGAAGLMRMPTRLRIGWESASVLSIETDAGRQTRLLHFEPPSSAGPPSRQGLSLARWMPPVTSIERAGPGRAGGSASPGDTLEVTTTNLLPGWLRRNGVPYSEQTMMTEYFEQFEAPNGDQWLIVTTIVEDRVYLDDLYITSSHFRREPDGSGWNPRECRED